MAGSARKLMAPPIWCESACVQSARPSSTAATAGCTTSRLGPGRLECRTAEQRARFEGCSVLRQFDQGRAAARADDLDETEAVHRRAFERLRQMLVDCRRGRLARRPIS